MALPFTFLLSMILTLLTLSTIMVTYAALRLRHALSKLSEAERASRTVPAAAPPVRAKAAPHPLLRR